MRPAVLRTLVRALAADGCQARLSWQAAQVRAYAAGADESKSSWIPSWLRSKLPGMHLCRVYSFCLLLTKPAPRLIWHSNRLCRRHEGERQRCACACECFVRRVDAGRCAASLQEQQPSTASPAVPNALAYAGFRSYLQNARKMGAATGYISSGSALSSHRARAQLRTYEDIIGCAAGHSPRAALPRLLPHCRAESPVARVLLADLPACMTPAAAAGHLTRHLLCQEYDP